MKRLKFGNENGPHVRQDRTGSWWCQRTANPQDCHGASAAEEVLIAELLKARRLLEDVGHIRVIRSVRAGLQRRIDDWLRSTELEPAAVSRADEEVVIKVRYDEKTGKYHALRPQPIQKIRKDQNPINGGKDWAQIRNTINQLVDLANQQPRGGR